MIRILAGLLLTAGLALPGETKPASELRGIKADFHGLFNEYRATKGLAPLNWGEQLAAEARRHGREVGTGVDKEDSHLRMLQRVDERFYTHNTVEVGVYLNDRPHATVLAFNSLLADDDAKAKVEGSFNLAGIGAVKDTDGGVLVIALLVQEEPPAFVPGPKPGDSSGSEFSAEGGCENPQLSLRDLQSAAREYWRRAVARVRARIEAAKQ